MKTSYQGRCFIAAREACVLVPYGDGDNFAIGFGHNDPALTKDSPAITIEQAWAQFAADLVPRELVVNSTVIVPLKQHEFDALVSLYYQAGTAALRAVAIRLSTGDVQGAMVELLSHNRDHSHSEFRLGLAKRRLLEATLFQTGDYGDISMMKLWRGDPHAGPPELVPFPPDTGALA